MKLLNLTRLTLLKLASWLKSLGRIVSQLLSNLLLGCIRLYQLLLSPYLGGQCRFYPTCSHYAVDAIRMHGPWIGIYLIFKRLARCQPLGGHGVDFVPIKLKTKNRVES